MSEDGSSSSTSAIIKQVEKKHKSRKSRSHKTTKKSKSNSKNINSETFIKNDSLIDKFKKMLENKKIFWGVLAAGLAIAIWLYTKKKNKKNLKNQELNTKNENIQDQELNTNNNLSNLNNLPDEVQIKLHNYNKLINQIEHDKNNNIVRIKLPEKYLTDNNGRPVILTPEIVNQIKNNPVHLNKKNNNNHNHNHNHINHNNIEDSKENLNSTEEFIENKNLQSQNLTQEEIADIKNQLEMMNKSNNIVASNT